MSDLSVYREDRFGPYQTDQIGPDPTDNKFKSASSLHVKKWSKNVKIATTKKL